MGVHSLPVWSTHSRSSLVNSFPFQFSLIPVPVWSTHSRSSLVNSFPVCLLVPSQFVQRLVLFAIPNKYKPDYQYLRQIPNRRIHAYTLFQVMFLLLLCVFKLVSQISIVFPIMVRPSAELRLEWPSSSVEIQILIASLPIAITC